MSALGFAVLRLGLAVVFVAHGAHTLFGTWAGPGIGPGGLDHTAAYLDSLGLHPAFLLALLAGLTELAGGCLVGIGYVTRWAALALVGDVGISIWKEQLQWGFFLNWAGETGHGHGVEYSVVLAAALVCLLLAGPGEWSIDGQRDRSAAYRASARARRSRI
jgi:putative oxidoreductase